MKTFEDLDFKMHPATKELVKQKDIISESTYEKFKDLKQARMKFDNGYSISVLLGKWFYSNGYSTYEAWCIELDEEPLAYLTKDEVTEYMIRIQNEKDRNANN